MSEEQAEYNVEKAKKDNAILKKYAAIQKASEDKIGCQKIYVDMTGDLKAAMVLDEIIFFTLPRPNTGKSALRVRKNGYLWMAVRRAEWWDRKRLSERESDAAIDKLEKLNLIVKSVHRFNSLPTVHLRLNVDEFFKLYFEALETDNPPEDESDSEMSDINDLYEMMGIPFSPNRNLPNGEGKSPNGDDLLPNGDSINSPDIALTQPSQDLTEKEINQVNAKVDAIIAGSIDPQRLREKQAIDAFESAFGLDRPWNWYPAKTSEEKTWRDFRAYVVEKYEADPQCFTRYVTWRNQKYSKGTMSNLAIKRSPQDFPDSWVMFLASDSMYGKEPAAPIYKPIPEDNNVYVPNPHRRTG